MLQSNVNFNLYKSFIAVYDHKNISKAAAALQITQPTVTYNIKELERQLGAKLFHTHPRGVEPTKDAHELYKWVNSGMESIATGEMSIKEFNEGSHGAIHVTVPNGLVSELVAKSIVEFNKKYPNIRFEIADAKNVDVLLRLSQYATDVALSIADVGVDKKFGVVDLRKLERVAIVSNAFAQEKNISEKLTAKDVEALPFIIFEKGRSTVSTKIKACPYVTVEGVGEMVALVREGAGVGICFDADLMDVKMDELVKLDVGSIGFESRVLRLVYNKAALTKSAKVFIEILKEVFGVN